MNDLSKYFAIKDQMHTGDLLQWRSSSVIGWLIRWKTDAEVNHSGLVLRMPEYEGEQKRRWTSEALEHGVYPILLSRRLACFDGSVWWHQLKPEFDSMRRIVGVKMAEMWGVGYDFGSLFKQIVAKVSTDTKAFFCSEYCYYCMGGEGTAPNPGEITKVGFWREEGVQIL